MRDLSARGEQFPSHCNTTGHNYETLVESEVGGLLGSAGWQRLGLAALDSASPAVALFQTGLSLYPGLAFGIGSSFEGIYANVDHPSRALHVEVSGSPEGRQIGGFAKSCTMHKADSRLQLSWRVGSAVGLQVNGILISNYLPALGSIAAATLQGLLDVMDVTYVITDTKGGVLRVLSALSLDELLSEPSSRRRH